MQIKPGAEIVKVIDGTITIVLERGVEGRWNWVPDTWIWSDHQTHWDIEDLAEHMCFNEKDQTAHWDYKYSAAGGGMSWVKR